LSGILVVFVGQFATQLRVPLSKNVPEGHLQLVLLKIAPATVHSNCFVQGFSLRSPAVHCVPYLAFCVASIPEGHDGTQPIWGNKTLPEGHMDVGVAVTNPSCVRFRILHAR
jgi:hypothetical protein